MSGGATATVHNNQISGNVFTPQTFASAGILLFGSGAVEASVNTVTDNDVGVYLQSETSGGVLVRNNDVSGSSFDGIDVIDSSDVVVRDNRSHGNTFDGIYADGTTDSFFKSNRLEGNAEDGIFLDADTSENTVETNLMQANARFDCHDESVGPHPPGVANVWRNDNGTTENKPGLCKGETP